MEALRQVETLVSAKLSVIKTVFTIFRLEARLAGLSVFPLLLNVCLLLIVLMTVWLLSSLLIGYGILLASNSFFISLVVTFLLNLAVFWGLTRYLAFNLKNMSFDKTRSYFSENKSNDDEQFKKAADSSNSHDGPDIKTPTNQGDGA